MWGIVFQKRRELIKDKLEPTTAIKEGNKVVDSKDQLAQIIDTTLLKCYLQVLYTGLQIRVRTGKLFSYFLNQNICCGCLKEPSQ